MLQTTNDAQNAQETEPPSEQTPASSRNESSNAGTFGWLKGLVKSKQQNGDSSSLRAALEGVIEEFEDRPDEEPIADHERILIANILKLRDMTVVDVMIPRADIVAIPLDTERSELFKLLSEKQYSRLPVYRDNLDDIIGTIHIKDILAELAKGHQDFKIKDLIRSVPIASPSMPVLDLMLDMQKTTKHISMVVDEYGGIDGLVTINDLVESIVGEIDDEYHNEAQPALIRHEDGTLTADARYDLEEFEDEFGTITSTEEREDVDTLGGLIFEIAGRIPARGEVLTHEDSGIKFEILDADPRRINKVKIHTQI